MCYYMYVIIFIIQLIAFENIFFKVYLLYEFTTCSKMNIQISQLFQY